MDHFLEQAVHLPVPGKMGFVFHGADKIPQYVCEALLMAVAVGIISAVVVMDKRSPEVFDRRL